MHKYRFDSSKMDSETLQNRIKQYTDCGWVFTGLMDFPPPHIWACFDWNKSQEPIHPEKHKEQN